MSAAISLKDVSFTYGSDNDKTEVLHNVSMDIEYAKISLLSGASGQGKSTLFHIMNGAIPHAINGNLIGSILVNGKRIQNQTLGQTAREVGSVLQNAETQILYPRVKDEIAFGLENFAFQCDDMQTIVNSVCKEMLLDKHSGTRNLSGGEKQKLITASILALNTKILILDEPLANLDCAAGLAILEKLKVLKEKGFAIVIIEHRIDVVIDYVDVVFNVANKKVEKIKDKKVWLQNNNNKITDTSQKIEAQEVLFDIQNLSYKVHSKVIIDSINFQIFKGERIVVLGDNGQGKSTFAKLLLRLIKPSGGTITQSLDKELGHKRGTKKWFKKVAYVFQNPNYQLFMQNVEDELLFSAYSLEYCQELVDMFKLEALLDRHPHSLSEGQKRKVGIATMLSMRPKVIVFDEPTVGQDYESLGNMVHIINTLHKKEHNTIITITHDKRCAKALCDRVVIMEQGSIKKVGGKELVDEYFGIKKTFNKKDYYS